MTHHASTHTPPGHQTWVTETGDCVTSAWRWSAADAVASLCGWAHRARMVHPDEGCVIACGRGRGSRRQWQYWAEMGEGHMRAAGCLPIT